MYERHTASHPMTFEIILDVSGEIDRKAVRESLDFIAERHPLALTRVENRSWVLPEATEIPFRWNSAALQPLDLCREGGIRMIGSENQLRFEFHHASTDAEGASLFVRDFAQAYEERTGGEVRRWSRHHIDGLLTRHKIPWPKSSGSGKPLSLWQRIQLAWQIVGRLPEQLQGDRYEPSAPSRPLHSYTFTTESTAKIWEYAQRESVNLSGVAFALLFRTLARWQVRHGVSTGLRRLRVLVPTSIRQLSDYRMGACNRNSFAFITRAREKALLCDSEFIEAMDQEMAFIRTARPDLSTLAGLELAQRYDLLKFVGGLPNLQSTAALTYLGDFTNTRQISEDGRLKFGNLTVTNCTGSPPISSGTRFAFAVNRAGKRMSIGLRSDAQTFSPEAERALVRSYAESWAEWARFKLEK